MSNGTNEPFEDKVGKPLGFSATLAIGYVVLWAVLAVLQKFSPLQFPGWVLWPSVVLLAIAVMRITQGFRDGSRRTRHDL